MSKHMKSPFANYEAQSIGELFTQEFHEEVLAKKANKITSSTKQGLLESGKLEEIAVGATPVSVSFACEDLGRIISLSSSFEAEVNFVASSVIKGFKLAVAEAELDPAEEIQYTGGYFNNEDVQQRYVVITLNPDIET